MRGCGCGSTELRTDLCRNSLRFDALTPASRPFFSAPQRDQIGTVLCRPVPQAKLAVGAPDGAYEREAYRIADSVVRMPEPRHDTATVRGGPQHVQRRCSECAEELQRKPQRESRPRCRSTGQ